MSCALEKCNYSTLEIPGKVDDAQLVTNVQSAQKKVEYIDNSLQFVTDRGFEFLIAQCPDLKKVKICYAAITDKTFSLLVSKCKIEDIILFNTVNITKQSFIELSNSPAKDTLKRLNLTNMPSLDVEGVESVLKNTSVQKLTLTLQWKITKAALIETLRKNKFESSKLISLTLTGLQCDDEVVEETIKKLPALQKLSLRLSSVTNKTLEIFAKSNLRKIKLVRFKADAQGDQMIARLREQGIEVKLVN